MRFYLQIIKVNDGWEPLFTWKSFFAFKVTET